MISISYAAFNNFSYIKQITFPEAVLLIAQKHGKEMSGIRSFKIIKY